MLLPFPRGKWNYSSWKPSQASKLDVTVLRRFTALSKVNEQKSDPEPHPTAQSSSEASDDVAYTGPVERFVNRKGKIAVMYSPGFGATWSSSDYYDDASKEQEILAFDKDIVRAILKKDYKLAASLANLKIYGKADDVPGYQEWHTKGVAIDWLDPGEQIKIFQYDGDDFIVSKKDCGWMRA
ncbi:MAG: hypothetical protein Q9225_005803 [Loekoesia sp. 1 TL-2023]